MTVTITAVHTTDGQYYEQGYVTVGLEIEGVVYSIQINFYCNLLATWKQEVVNGTETTIAKKVTYEYIDGVLSKNGNNFTQVRNALGDLQTWKSDMTKNGGTLSQMNTRINNASESVSTLQETVNGHTESISEIRQTADRISLTVEGSGAIELLDSSSQSAALTVSARSSMTDTDGNGYGYMKKLLTLDTSRLLSASANGEMNRGKGFDQNKLPFAPYVIEVSADFVVSANSVLSSRTGHMALYAQPQEYDGGTIGSDCQIGVTFTRGTTAQAVNQRLSATFYWNYPLDCFRYLRMESGLTGTIRNPSVKLMPASSVDSLKKTGIDISQGIIVLDAEKVAVTGDLVSKSLQTPGANGYPIRISDGVFEILNSAGTAGIRIAWDDNGAPYFLFTNADGSKAYTVNYDGFDKITQAVINAKWTEVYWKLVNASNDNKLGAYGLVRYTSVRTKFYEYQEQYNYETKQYQYGGGYNGKTYKTKSVSMSENGSPSSSVLIPDGWYISGTLGPHVDGAVTSSAGTVYVSHIYHFVGGMRTDNKAIYFTGNETNHYRFLNSSGAVVLYSTIKEYMSGIYGITIY